MPQNPGALEETETGRPFVFACTHTHTHTAPAEDEGGPHPAHTFIGSVTCVRVATSRSLLQAVPPSSRTTSGDVTPGSTPCEPPTVPRP